MCGYVFYLFFPFNWKRMCANTCLHSSDLKSIALAHLLCTIRFLKSIPLAKKKTIKVHKIGGYKIPVVFSFVVVVFSMFFFHFDSFVCRFVNILFQQVRFANHRTMFKLKIEVFYQLYFIRSRANARTFLSIHVCFIEFICCHFFAGPKN